MAARSSRAAVATRMQARRNSASAAGTRAAAVRIKVVPPITARIAVVLTGRGLCALAVADGCRDAGGDGNGTDPRSDRAFPTAVPEMASARSHHPELVPLPEALHRLHQKLTPGRHIWPPAQQRTALPLSHPAPDAEFDVVVKGVG
jgi:hypothetical protein